MKPVSWKEAIDLAGLLAVLLGLLLVYKEVEIIETIARAQLSADVNNSLFELEQIALGQEMASTFTKANERPENLTATERWQLNLFLSQVLDLYARECYYVEIGIFRECESVPRATALKYFSSRYGRAFWATVRNRMVGPEISAIIDETLTRNPANDIAQQIDATVLKNLESQ